MALKLPKEEMEENWELIKKITLFLFKEDFKKHKTTTPAKPPLKPQKSSLANHRLIEKGREVLKEQENLKKVFKTMMMLGSGGFGSVYVGKDLTQAKMRVAIKKLSHIEEKRRITNLAEIGFLASCDHPNIVQYFSAWISSDPKKATDIYLILEYLQGGTLSQAVSSFQFGELQIAFLGREILKALQYLHQRNWAHRDLKSANVMLDINGNVKIIDFGLCIDVTDGSLTTMVGSPYWIPPEMIKGAPHNLPVDIWSFGVCLLELFLLSPPYHKSPLKCMYKVATEGLAHLIPKGATQEAKQLLERCLEQNPNDRPTPEELLQMSFFQRQGVDKALAGVLRDIFMTNSLTSVM
uniref:Protein kinase domain-containing protein n=1 Tax=Arcella intermedia TaxID=1963864 RepID=A0A6B2L5I6_9EUKA